MSAADVVFDFIRDYVRQHGYPPSVRDICAGTGLSSTSTVYSHLLTLRREGRVDWESGKRRTMTLVEQ